MDENEVPKPANRFSYYVVAHWSLPGTPLGGFVGREVILDAPFVEAQQIENLALGIAQTIPVQVRTGENAMLVGNDVPKPVCVITGIYELRAWYDPRSINEIVGTRKT